jgi:hypothetical protein
MYRYLAQPGGLSGSQTIVLLHFDEIGLAEGSPNNPLKVLHYPQIHASNTTRTDASTHNPPRSNTRLNIRYFMHGWNQHRVPSENPTLLLLVVPVFVCVCLCVCLCLCAPALSLFYS